MGRPALAIGGLALIVVGAVVAFGWGWPGRETESSQVGTPVRSVEFEVTAGNVQIRAGEVAGTSIRETFHTHGLHFGGSGHTYHVDGDKLVLDDCGSDCTVDYEIVVPRGTTVHGQTTSGSIDVTGLSGGDLQTTSGDVDADEISGPVRANSNSGSLSVELVSPQDVTAETDSGDIDLRVPPDAYRVLTDHTSGHADVQVTADPAGAHTLDLRATSGDIEVRPR